MIGLAKTIHDHNGMEGAELEAFTFYVSACFADAMGRKDIGDYFNGRCQKAKAKLKEAK